MKRLLFFLIIISYASAIETRQEAIDKLPISTYPTAAAWKRLGVKDHRGIRLPLLSIISQKSSGNGEFLDLIPLVDWLSHNHLDLLQLLPLNDTEGISSPYSPISGQALHPIYLSLEALPYLDSAPPHLIQKLKKLKQYNKTERVEYLTILHKKEEWLEEYLQIFSHKILTHPKYQQFAKTPWVKPFALFKALRKKHGAVIRKWPSKILHNPHQTLLEIPPSLQTEIHHHMVIQFLCYEQMHYVHTYANAHNVFLIGDMSFMVSKDSVEIWRFPHLFKLDYSVGTQPGHIVPHGENWELPPYNWEEIEKSGYAFFKDRLESLESYYDIIRLDHASGYYAQYEIPVGKTPEAGKYLPAHRQDQLSAGKRHLSAIASLTKMLPFAEDLHFKKDMDTIVINLGIPGIRLFVFLNTKAPIEHLVTSGKGFNLMTITSLANHDLPPFRTWWLNHPKRAKAYANQVQWKYYKQPSLEQQRELLWKQMHSNSLLHVELLQDILPPNLTHPPEHERINYPGTISKTNWTYRYTLSVEELTTHPEVQKTLQIMLAPQAP